ncbi:MAG: thrombospondin type 3 repeat-containing protein, partial [Bradymonadia bacterium]
MRVPSLHSLLVFRYALPLCVLLGCQEEAPTSRVSVDIQPCVETVVGPPEQYNRCAPSAGLPLLNELRGCFVWKVGRTIGWSTLHYRDGWVPDPTQSQGHGFQLTNFTGATFFVGSEVLQCQVLTPDMACRNAEGCLFALTDGRINADANDRITFLDGDNECATVALLPGKFRECIESSNVDSFIGVDAGLVDAGMTPDAQLPDADVAVDATQSLDRSIPIPECEVTGECDDDLDGVFNDVDNCPLIANPEQLDRDEDGLGDACDNCPLEFNRLQNDSDDDGHGNQCDNCRYLWNPTQSDADQDGVGDSCDVCPT